MCIRVSVYRDAYGCVYECVYAPVGWWTNKGQSGCHSFSHSVGVCVYVGIYSLGESLVAHLWVGGQGPESRGHLSSSVGGCVAHGEVGGGGSE